MQHSKLLWPPKDPNVFDELRRVKDEAEELDLTPVMNLFMVLIPFLLMGAAFFTVGVIPTSTPNHTPGGSDAPPNLESVSASLVLEPDELRISFSSSGLSKSELEQLSNQWTVKNGEMPAQELQDYLRTVKQKYPQSTTLIVLPSGDLPYQKLVAVLDKTREFKSGNTPDGDPIYTELFPVTVFSKLIKSDPDEADEDAPEEPADDAPTAPAEGAP